MEPQTSRQLYETIEALLTKGKGILAADEPVATIENRFNAFGIICTPQNRKVYREMLFTTPGLSNFISGAIMVGETMRQETEAGAVMLTILGAQGITPGVCVDRGTVPLADSPGEVITDGFDGLRDRLDEYRKLGACFSKWRAAITIGKGIPTRACIEANARGLALFASLSQEAGLVPIIEPEILSSGSHTIDRSEEIATTTLETVFGSLAEHRVVFEQLILKTGMILPGAECEEPVNHTSVAKATLRCLRRAVPAAVPGIVFLSGGQESIKATERLNAICQTAPENSWRLSFCFSRALQAPALMMWQGNCANLTAAQSALYHRARCNSAATCGEYSSQLELSDSRQSFLQVSN